LSYAHHTIADFGLRISERQAGRLVHSTIRFHNPKSLLARPG